MKLFSFSLSQRSVFWRLFCQFCELSKTEKEDGSHKKHNVVHSYIIVALIPILIFNFGGCFFFLQNCRLSFPFSVYLNVCLRDKHRP